MGFLEQCLVLWQRLEDCASGQLWIRDGWGRPKDQRFLFHHNGTYLDLRGGDKVVGLKGVERVFFFFAWWWSGCRDALQGPALQLVHSPMDLLMLLATVVGAATFAATEIGLVFLLALFMTDSTRFAIVFIITGRAGGGGGGLLDVLDEQVAGGDGLLHKFKKRRRRRRKKEEMREAVPCVCVYEWKSEWDGAALFFLSLQDAAASDRAAIKEVYGRT